MKVDVIILAAGKGKRMCSKLPKVLQPIGGLPMLERVVNTALELKPANIFVVYGVGGDEVKTRLAHLPVQWIEQAQQLGTAHAVHQAIDQINPQHQVLILYGDVPLINGELLQELLTNSQANEIGLVTAELEDPSGFGRIIRNDADEIVAIIEEKDLTTDQQHIDEINTGIMSIPAKMLQEYLPQIENSNAQGEYYLTDIIELAVANDKTINSTITTTPEEVLGANDKFQLACLERYFQYQNAKRLMEQGLTLFDPERFDLRGELTFGYDVSIEPNVIIEGRVKLGNNCKIGANTVLRNITIGDNVEILENCVLEESTIANNCKIGPFARVRPQSVIHDSAHVGNFVELKKTELGENSKANHLTYLGDSIIGKNVNIGAGTITCNYDGANKYQTTIEDGVFVGSNCALVAPVNLGKNSTTGAGSTITADIPAEELTIARARQVTVKGWQRPQKNKKDQ